MPAIVGIWREQVVNRVWLWRVSNLSLVFFLAWLSRKLWARYGGIKPLTCYVKKPSDSTLDGAESQLLGMVSKMMTHNHNLYLNIVEVEEVPSDSSAVTFIVCPVISRVGSNVEYALKGINSQKNMALLLFHPVARHVPFTGNSRGVLVQPKHLDLGDIVDIVMWPASDGKSLYDCEQNRQAVQQICRFINGINPSSKKQQVSLKVFLYTFLVCGLSERLIYLITGYSYFF